MNKIKRMVRKPYFLILLCICLFLFLSSLKLRAFNTPVAKKQIDFPFISLVPDVAIIDIEVHKYDVSLLLKNNSNKAITAIALSSSGVIYRTDMIGTDEVMAPGATRIEGCNIPSDTRPEKGITIRAVTYEDGTADGDPQFIKQIFDYRAGTQAQMGRFLPLFRSVLATPKNTRLMQKKEEIKLQLEQLSEEAEGKSFEYRTGLHDMREMAIKKFAEIEQIEQEKGEDLARQILPKIVEQYEKRNLAIMNSLKQSRYQSQ